VAIEMEQTAFPPSWLPLEHLKQLKVPSMWQNTEAAAFAGLIASFPKGAAVLHKNMKQYRRRLELLRERPNMDGKRVLIIDPMSSQGRLPSQIARIAWRLSLIARQSNVQLDALVWNNNISAGIVNAIRPWYKRLHLSPAKGPGYAMRWSKLLARLRYCQYSAVITWQELQVGFADRIAGDLGVPNVRRTLGGVRAKGLALNKGLARKLVNDYTSDRRGALPYSIVTNVREAMQQAIVVGFPLFLKPLLGTGQSAGMATELLSGRINDMEKLQAEVTRILGDDIAWLQMAKRSNTRLRHLIMEPFLNGPEIFAETTVMGGVPLAVSLRASKLPRRPEAATNLPSEWHWPALLEEAEAAECQEAARNIVRALELQNGVFGIQLVLDRKLGCTFLEVNVRPHNWDMLHDTSAQLFLQPDLWHYGLMALMIALGQPPHAFMHLATKPAMRLSAFCCGNHRESQLIHRETLMFYRLATMQHDIVNNTCTVVLWRQEAVAMWDVRHLSC